MSRAHRVLIGVVVAGALVIAGIGFAGSYAAVRELALKKGFGNFSYVFPVGIDAGICVLLALDLLLTWMRIPFPMLRQTAWLLTAATIAFNGAAAWPDPLGTGMHAVIPILFVVSVEAARHAVGRIADITADKHMEGVRLTRWMLSPLPTFLLWRRMKLWELRSYEQVIKLEQERLVYQARLRSRFGRAWRRKAPVESLMPLRLARYGVPLAETAPAGLAAAGIEPVLLAPVPDPVPELPQPAPAALQAEGAPRVEGDAGQGGVRQPLVPRVDKTRRADAYQEWLAAFGVEPTSAQFAAWLQDRHGAIGATRYALPGPQVDVTLREVSFRLAPLQAVPAPTDTEVPAGPPGVIGPPLTAVRTKTSDLPDADLAGESRSGDHPAPDAAEETTSLSRPGSDAESKSEQTQADSPALEAQKRVSAKGEEGHDALPPPPADAGELTTVDTYYTEWLAYQAEHGVEPSADELSAFLAEHGLFGRGRKPVNPSTLRRYLLPFRIYKVWADHRAQQETPARDLVARTCAERGITAQYNRPLSKDQIGEYFPDFERRWSILSRHGINPELEAGLGQDARLHQPT
ncbi:DUF2637 domain-containing protein [Streptomyces sp. NPDC004286]|uniref:DUF2637 domain-containing protein n=1 Tax=Streptomyces sp. NPDC004286 TaxID=3364696 RepID=UPI0036A4CFFC